MTHHPDLLALFAAVRAWVFTHYPNACRATLLVRLDNGDRGRLPIPLSLDGAAPHAAARRDGASSCRDDILAVLQDVGRRLTTTELLSELEARDMLWGERTVMGYLARMVHDGTLTNDPQARPRGYGLPDLVGP